MNFLEGLQNEMQKFMNSINEKYQKEVAGMKQEVEELKKPTPRQLFEAEAKRYVVDNIRPNFENQTDKENMVKVDDIHENFKELIEVNAKSPDEPVADIIERIADPNIPTKITNMEVSGLTPEKKKWLMEYIFLVEGGYFNHPNDPGGETMYGITKVDARTGGYTGPMRDLPKEFAIQRYHNKYFIDQQLQKINHFGKQLCIFDFIVNSGLRGIKMAQKAVNSAYAERNTVKDDIAKELAKITPLSVDGVIGPKTIEAINNCPFFIFYTNYIMYQEDQYEDLMRANGKLRSFDEGWENRIARKNQFIFRLLKEGVITLD